MHLTWNIPAQKKRQYAVHIGSNALKDLHVQLSEYPNTDHVVILYDNNVRSIAEPIITQQTLPCFAIAVPGTEESKSLKQYERIVEDMLSKGATSNSVLIIVGGGMLGDLGSFIASTFKRGMQSVLVPTSFTAMVDAALGGKTSLNIGKVKNCIGSNHHHSAIYIDTSLLQNQKQEWIEGGLVEVVKIAALRDAELFGWIEEHCDSIVHKEPKILELCIKHAVQSKQALWQDEQFTRPAVSGMLFGHVIGHALEALTHFSLTHTQAVSIGMNIEIRMTNSKVQERIVSVLKRLNQPLEIPIEVRTQALWDLIKTENYTTVVVPTSIGGSVVARCSFEDLVRSRDQE